MIISFLSFFPWLLFGVSVDTKKERKRKRRRSKQDSGRDRVSTSLFGVARSLPLPDVGRATFSLFPPHRRVFVFALARLSRSFTRTHTHTDSRRHDDNPIPSHSPLFFFLFDGPTPIHPKLVSLSSPHDPSLPLLCVWARPGLLSQHVRQRHLLYQTPNSPSFLYLFN